MILLVKLWCSRDVHELQPLNTTYRLLRLTPRTAMPKFGLGASGGMARGGAGKRCWGLEGGVVLLVCGCVCGRGAVDFAGQTLVQ